MGIRSHILIIAEILLVFCTNIYAQKTISVHDIKLSYTNSLDQKKGNVTSGNSINASSDTLYFRGDSIKSGGFFTHLPQNAQHNTDVQIESTYWYMSPLIIKKDTAIFLFNLVDIITLAFDTNGGSEGSCKRRLSFFIKTSHNCSLYMHMDNVELEGSLPPESSIRIAINGKSSIYQREKNKKLVFNLRKGENSVYIDIYNGTEKRSNMGQENSKYWVLSSDLGFEVILK